MATPGGAAPSGGRALIGPVGGMVGPPSPGPAVRCTGPKCDFNSGVGAGISMDAGFTGDVAAAGGGGGAIIGDGVIMAAGATIISGAAPIGAAPSPTTWIALSI